MLRLKSIIILIITIFSFIIPFSMPFANASNVAHAQTNTYSPFETVQKALTVSPNNAYIINLNGNYYFVYLSVNTVYVFTMNSQGYITSSVGTFQLANASSTYANGNNAAGAGMVYAGGGEFVIAGAQYDSDNNIYVTFYTLNLTSKAFSIIGSGLIANIKPFVNGFMLVVPTSYGVSSNTYSALVVTAYFTVAGSYPAPVNSNVEYFFVLDSAGTWHVAQLYSNTVQDSYIYVMPDMFLFPNAYGSGNTLVYFETLSGNTVTAHIYLYSSTLTQVASESYILTTSYKIPENIAFSYDFGFGSTSSTYISYVSLILFNDIPLYYYADYVNYPITLVNGGNEYIEFQFFYETTSNYFINTYFELGVNTNFAQTGSGSFIQISIPSGYYPYPLFTVSPNGAYNLFVQSSSTSMTYIQFFLNGTVTQNTALTNLPSYPMGFMASSPFNFSTYSVPSWVGIINITFYTLTSLISTSTTTISPSTGSGSTSTTISNSTGVSTTTPTSGSTTSFSIYYLNNAMNFMLPLVFILLPAIVLMVYLGTKGFIGGLSLGMVIGVYAGFIPIWALVFLGIVMLFLIFWRERGDVSV